MADEEYDGPDPWEFSEAKKLLERDIVNGLVGSVATGLAPKEVYVMRPEYADYEYPKFVRWLYSLRVKYEELLNLAAEDGEALAHDLQLGLRINSKPYPRWPGSDAERLLNQDIKAGKHLEMKPRELLASRPEYAPWVPFPKIFRDHIHQELRAQLERPYWLAHRKEKQEEKRKAARQKVVRQKAAEKKRKEAKEKKKKALDHKRVTISH